MSLPVTVSSALEDIGYVYNYYSNNAYHNNLSISNRDISNFSIGVEAIIHNNEFVECPIILASYVQRVLSNHNVLNPNRIKKVIRYLDINDNYTSFVNTCTPIFNSLASDSFLRKMILKESEVYYIDKGIILDKNKKPLFLFCTTIKKEENRDAYFTDPVIYVAEKVFTTKDPVCKYIKDKVLPFYFTECYFLGEYHENRPIKVIVNDKEINKFFTKPNKPKNTNTNENLNKLLLDNIDELFK